tara:strand:+ start:725 stop:1081 length:357 start_codon:yes stop_codon:yes gene_type:complete
MNGSSTVICIDIIACLMLTVSAISFCYPWKPDQPFAATLVHLPLLFVLLWIAYEAFMPDEMNIRVDLFYIVPLLFVLLVTWLVKIARFRKVRERSAEEGIAGKSVERSGPIESPDQNS